MRVVNYQIKQRYALVLACSIYAIFLFFLIFDIQLPLSKKHTITKTSVTPQTIMPKMKRKGPAPIRYHSPPNKQPKTKPQPPAPKPQSIISKPATQQEKPKKNLPKEEQHKIIKKKETDKKKVIPRYKKRSRDKWFKQRITQEKLNHSQNQTQAPQQTQQKFVSQMSHGFNNYVNKQKAEHAQYSIPKKMGDRAESLEYEMFMGKFTHALCVRSHKQPLIPHSKLIKKHFITAEITCDQQRNIQNFRLLSPSYDPQINEYLKEIVYETIPPQIPKTHKKDLLIFPIHIEIQRQYYVHKITLAPA